MNRTIRRLGLIAAAFVVLFATPAFAHVSVNPTEVPAGEAAALTFRVPNETSDANTVKVEVVLPEGVTFEFVSVKPVAGWTHTEARSGDAVTGVTWEGGEIEPGEFEEFSISAGPIAGDTLEFKAIQTYDNGDVVRWIDPVVEGEEEPEHPAPTATVVAGDEDGHGAAAPSEETEDGDDDGTEPIVFVSLVVAGAALVAAVAALIMGRKRPPA